MTLSLCHSVKLSLCHAVTVSKHPNDNPINAHLPTFARDLKLLGLTHDAVRLAAFDQFPYSHHLESGVILRRKSSEELVAAAAVAAVAAEAASSSSSSASSSSSSSSVAAGVTDNLTNNGDTGMKIDEIEEEGSGNDATSVGGAESNKSEYIPGVLFKITNVPSTMNTYQLKDLLSKVVRIRYVDRNDDGSNLPCQYTPSTHSINLSYQPTLSTHPINTSYQHTLSIHPITAPYQYTNFLCQHIFQYALAVYFTNTLCKYIPMITHPNPPSPTLYHPFPDY